MTLHTFRRDRQRPRPHPVSGILIPLSAILSLLVPVQASQGNTATVVRAIPMKAMPDTAAPDILQLQAEQAVEVRQRQGGWYAVSPDGQRQGWVRLLALRFERAAYRPGSMGVGSLLSVVKTGHSDITVTTGVRGLNEEQLRQARADLGALEKMQKLAVAEAEAREFAAGEGLTSQPVGYLEAAQ